MSTDEGQGTSLDDLLKTLESGETPAREQAAQELGNLGDQRAVAPLAELVPRINLEKNLRLALIEALGKLGGQQAVPALRSVFMDDDPQLSQAAAKALEKLGVSKMSFPPPISRSSPGGPPAAPAPTRPAPRKWRRLIILLSVILVIVVAGGVVLVGLGYFTDKGDSSSGGGQITEFPIPNSDGFLPIDITAGPNGSL
jgi:hypothetical protein